MSPPSRRRRVAQVALGLLGLSTVAVGGLLAYAWGTADQRLSHPDTPFPDVRAATDLASIERGRYLVFGPAHCSSCHGGTDRAHPETLVPDIPLTGGLEFAMGPLGSSWAANLTPDVATGIGGRTDAELARAIRTGVLHDGRVSILMRYSAANLADEDLAAVLGYLRSAAPVSHPVPPAEQGGLPLVSLFFHLTPDGSPTPAWADAGAEPSLARGAYLAESVMLCTSCHTPYDPATFEPAGSPGSGGTVEASHGEDSDMEYAPPNLTSHPTGVTGKLDEEAFLARIRHGRVYPSSIMPWENFAVTTESDLRSVYRYLKTLPPVDNDVGPTYRPVGWKPGDAVAPG